MNETRCAIQWVDANGKPTPDTNLAIGCVRREAYRHPYAGAVNGYIEYTESEWYPICAEHAKRLGDGGMHHWEFRGLDDTDGGAA